MPVPPALAARPATKVLVYHSPANDGGAAPAPPVLDASTPQSLDLYVDLEGSRPTQKGVACESGDGSELCGWDFTFRASPGVELEDFAPEPGVDALLDGKTLRVNGLHAKGPSTAPVRIGRLRVVRETPSGGTVVVRGVAVAADLSLVELAPTTVAEIVLPEPAASSHWRSEQACSPGQLGVAAGREPESAMPAAGHSSADVIAEATRRRGGRGLGPSGVGPARQLPLRPIHARASSLRAVGKTRSSPGIRKPNSVTA